MTILKTCKCNHTYQGKKYGKKIRVYNIMKDTTKAKCTVCRNIKTI